MDLGLKYFGFRWWHFFSVKKRISGRKYGKFDLIIDTQTKFRNTLILKKIPHNLFFSRTLSGVFSTHKIKFRSDDYLGNLCIFLKQEINKIDFSVSKLPKEILSEAKRLLPNSNYIGLSVTQGNVYIKKICSIYNFI